MDKEQARKLYELADRLSKVDVNTLSEEQLAERSAMIARLQEVKQRLDPKCWDGYKKQGTKMKGDTRVNNCVPESVTEGLESLRAKAKEISDKIDAIVMSGGRVGLDDPLSRQLKAIHNKIKQAKQGTTEGYTVTPGIDRERYQPRDGLEGPFSTKSGKVVYYDKVEGKYYDPDTDMYIEYADWQAMNESNGEYNDEAGMAESNLHTMARAVAGLIKTIESDDNLPEWAQEKIAKAEMMVTSVWDYLLSQKEQGVDPKVEDVTEGVAESMPMSDAVKVLRHYGADHFKTTSNELHFYKNGRPLSIELIWNDDATRSVSLSQLNSASRQLKGQGVAEAKKPSPKLTPVDIKKTDPVSEEINTEAYERLQKVFAFKNYES